MKSFFFYCFLFFSSCATAQNTIGLQYLNSDINNKGYTLLYPERQATAFLINECGEIVHSWEDANPDSRPGAVAYLLENGNLLKAKSESAVLSSGGTGGILELVSWENEILWRYEINDTIVQHHDIHAMPNGNILVIGSEKMEYEDMVAKGFDTLTNIQSSLYFDAILEINPTLDSVVWEWHAWDHLIQNFDSSKDNYGEITNYPERININYQEFTASKPDFLHCNAIDYNAERNQVMLSVRNFNEVWMIDHSTTTAESASSTGGQSGKGGDLIYRWGNPHAYQASSLDDRQLFRQHDAQWIDDLVDSNYVHFGKIAIFNNLVDNGLSLGQVFAPQWNSITQTYEQESNVFLPTNFSATFVHPQSEKNYSGVASSIQIIGDGHVIMCAAQQGRVFELSPDGNLAWEYVTPLRNGQAVPQGFELGISENFTFQVQRYPADYPAFVGRDLTPKGFIELEPNEGFCGLVSVNDIQPASFYLFPNPALQEFSIYTEVPFSGVIYDIYGRRIKIIEIEKTSIINCSFWNSGLYFLLNKKTHKVIPFIIQ